LAQVVGITYPSALLVWSFNLWWGFAQMGLRLRRCAKGKGKGKDKGTDNNE